MTGFAQWNRSRKNWRRSGKTGQTQKVVYVSGDSVPGGASAGGAERQMSAKTELPTAIPEDIQEVVKNFRSIADEASGMIRGYLKKARLSLGGDNRLLIVLPDSLGGRVSWEEKIMSRNWTESDRTENRKEGGSRCALHVEEGRHFEDTFVDIEQKINMEITSGGLNMAKRGGFPGGGMPGNMANLMKQAQRMQRQMEEQQKELESKEFTATAGGGAVEVTVSGKREVLKVKLAEEVVDPDDIEMLEDLIVAASNEALRKVEEESGAAMSKLTGGIPADVSLRMF